MSVVGLSGLAPGRPVELVFRHEGGSEDRTRATHTLSADQIEWFRAGSALNVLRQAS